MSLIIMNYELRSYDDDHGIFSERIKKKVVERLPGTHGRPWLKAVEEREERMDRNNIYEKCIERHRKQNRFQAVLKENLAAYLSRIDETVSKKTLKKDLIEIAYAHLTPETLADFTQNIPSFGLTIYDAMEILGLTQYQARKLANQGRLEKVGEMYGDICRSAGRRKTYFMYSIPSIIGASSVKFESKTYDVEPTDSNLVEALYLVNKSAKVSRDTKQKAYAEGDHSVCHAAKTRAEKLYDLKDRAMKKLVDEGKMSFVGVQGQKIGDTRVCYLDKYAMCGFSFHVPHVGAVNEAEILSVIEGTISAEKTRKVGLTFSEAKYLLERYTA